MPGFWPILAGGSLLVWLYLLFGRGGFWRCVDEPAGPPGPPGPETWPAVAAVVPARNEAPLLEATLPALLGQDYPGPFRVILADDHSTDATAEAAARIARRAGRGDRLTIVRARALPPGWTGKLWAMSEGLRRAEADGPAPRYIWFTDADIVHPPSALRALTARAEAGRLDLVSLMVRLHCRAPWERLLVPAFVFFFQKLYPFPWVNDPARRTAAAAGGSMLVRAGALRRAGGLGPIRGALIDDCALAGRIKRLGAPGGGRIRLGLARASRSVRPYEGLGGIWRTVARTAYTQLRHSPPLLAATLAAMALAYLVPPAAALAYPLHGQAATAALGLGGWALMSGLYLPTLRRYGQPPALAPLLPAAALLYGAMTAHSAAAHLRGAGGGWKGRIRPAPPREGVPEGVEAERPEG